MIDCGRYLRICSTLSAVATVHMIHATIPSAVMVGTASSLDIHTPLLSCPCQYQPDNGVYYSTYGGKLQAPQVPASAFVELDEVLSYSYIRGVAHYQNWSTFEPEDGQYNFSTIDTIFELAQKHNKHVILGMQMGVCAPLWVLEHPDVATVDFVHSNPGWSHWSTLQHYAQGYLVTTMAVPWVENAVYGSYTERVVRALAVRYANNSQLAYVNVCGPSASGGVEANFNVDYKASRVVNAQYDTEMNYTLNHYVTAWEHQIDLYVSLFPRSGMATHDETGQQGYDPQSHAIVDYDVNDRMTTARAIRNYMINQHKLKKRRRNPIIRCCGGNNITAEWGKPGTTVDKPPKDTYALLMWEVREVADVGFEPASVQLLSGRTASEFQTMLDIDLYYNGRFLEIKRPDLITNSGQPELMYKQDLITTSQRMVGCLPWNCTSNARS
eukprot:m.169451 g.169451  ORF g.169451 m.169451 type:complete len:440 (+) comp31572_c0_seq1:322-1641(+)